VGQHILAVVDVAVVAAPEVVVYGQAAERQTSEVVVLVVEGEFESAVAQHSLAVVAVVAVP
jgi:hypothetical protein